MIEFLALALLAMAGLAVAATVGFVFLLLKLVFWVVLLPLKILVKLLWIPVGLLIGALGLVVAMPVALLLIVLALVGFGVLVLGLALPAIPFVLLGLLVWSLRRPRPIAAA